MRFTVMIWPHSGVTVEPVVRLTQVAEAQGFEAVYVGDSQMLWNDVWVILGCCATATSRVQLGPGVTNTVTRHPTVTANAIMTLNMASKGRAVLGVGAGDSAVRTAGLNPDKMPQLRERVTMMRALLNGEDVEVSLTPEQAARRAWGVETTIRMAGADEWGRIPIEIAVMGKKAATASAEFADGVIVDGHMGGNAEGAAATVECVADGATRAGKDPASVRVIAALDLSIEDDRTTALDKVRTTAARTIARKPWLPDTIGVEHADVVEAVSESYKFSEHLDLTAHHRKLIPDEVAMKCTIAGTPEDCIEKVRELETAGVTDIAVEITSQNEEVARRSLERFGGEVMPHC